MEKIFGIVVVTFLAVLAFSGIAMTAIGHFRRKIAIKAAGQLVEGVTLIIMGVAGLLLARFHVLPPNVDGTYGYAGFSAYCTFGLGAVFLVLALQNARIIMVHPGQPPRETIYEKAFHRLTK